MSLQLLQERPPFLFENWIPLKVVLVTFVVMCGELLSNCADQDQIKSRFCMCNLGSSRRKVV